MLSMSTHTTDDQSDGSRKRRFKPKVKTGCTTCRIRRVKCDEGKPACNRCLSTGRTCDGYQPLFRITTASRLPTSRENGLADPRPSVTTYRPSASMVTANSNSLARHFIIKRPGMSIDHNTEALATLEALSDPAIRHALISFDALSAIFDVNRDILAIKNGTALINVHRGLEAYNTAVFSLASRLGGGHSQASVRVALLCCRLFISIELTLGDFASAMQHFLRGLRIMHEYCGRPAVDDTGQISPCSDVNTPFLDCFIIKLFASDHSNSEEETRSAGAQAAFGPVIARTTLRDDARSELADLSRQALEFLGKLSTLCDQSQVAGLLAWRSHILTMLQSWENTYLGTAKQFMDSSFPIEVRFYVAFSPLLHRVLKVVISLAMSCSAANMDVLEADFQGLRDIAGFLTETKKLLIKRAG